VKAKSKVKASESDDDQSILDSDMDAISGSEFVGRTKDETPWIRNQSSSFAVEQKRHLTVLRHENWPHDHSLRRTLLQMGNMTRFSKTQSNHFKPPLP
jgi:hypothetical protein